MLRQGRFPLFVHAVVEYLAGALLVAAPFLFSFDSGGATAFSIVAGVAVLAVAASTDWGLAVMRSIPVGMHMALDFVLAGVVIASPFIFGYSGETTPTAFFIAIGVAHLLLTLGTRFVRDAEPAAEPPAAVAPDDDASDDGDPPDGHARDDQPHPPAAG